MPVTDVEELVSAIHTAFRGVPRGEITLHEAEVIDDYGRPEERSAARRRDSETRWEKIPDKHIERCPDALCHVDPQSWCYYLPRYMEWTLQHHRTTRSMSADHTIYALLLGDDRSLNDYSRTRYRMLTPEQRHVVSRFLQFMAQVERADTAAAAEALRKYWGRFAF